MAGGRQHTTEESAEKRKRVLGMAIEHLGCRRGLRGPRVCVRLLPTDRWLIMADEARHRISRSAQSATALRRRATLESSATIRDSVWW